jgi:PmbA protein
VAEALDLEEICRVAVGGARADEAVEAYAQESRRTEVRAREGAIESLSFAETRGVGIRVIFEDRLGYAYASDPSLQELSDSLERARANARLATADPAHLLPDAGAAEAMPELFSEETARLDVRRKLALAADLERAAVRLHPSVRKLERASYGDAVSRVVIGSTRAAQKGYERTDSWCSVSALAQSGGETQSGFAFRLARDVSDLDWEGCAAEAVERGRRLLGATKPQSGRVPVVLDPHAAISFLGVLAGALSADSVQKGRSLFASMLGETVGSGVVSIVDDGRFLLGAAAAPFDDEGVPTRRTSVVERGRLAAFLHSTYTAVKAGVLSTGNAGRGGYRTPPGVSSSNFYLEPGRAAPSRLLEAAQAGVYVQDVSGVHSGANPVSGEFSVGATGLRISGGSLAEPLREMTIASTLPDVLRSVVSVADDLSFLGSTGSPTVLVGEMTVGGL